MKENARQGTGMARCRRSVTAPWRLTTRREDQKKKLEIDPIHADTVRLI